MQNSLSRLKGLRVLIIDDHRDSADSLAMLLSKAGCRTRVCYGGLDGLAAAEELLPQVVLLDLLMPGLDGYEVARQLAARLPHARPILVALSGYSHHEPQQKTMLTSAGFDFYFLKPADIRELLTTISWAAGQRGGEELFAEYQAA